MKYLSLSFLLLIGFNFFIWDSILTSISENEDLKIYFLDVGQGDSELIVLPGGVKILIDGGPSKEASFELGEVLSPTDRYIDVIAMTHAQKDHFGGLADVVSRYQVGAFVWNGEGALSDEWLEFEKILLEHDIPTVVLGVGDRIINNEEEVIVLAPNKDLIKESNANEGSLVLKLKSEDVSALFTGDISIETENKILEGQDLDVDVLKVAHHGSKYSTGANFLEEVTPAIAVIEVGNNTYGHPTAIVLQKLQMMGTSIYRTDKNGRVKLLIQDGKIGVDIEK